MNSRQRLEMMALEGAQGVINDHAAEVSGVAAAGAKTELDSILVRLNPQVAAQSLSTVAALAATQTHYASRRKLVLEHMATIVAVAKAKVTGVPELGVVRMPKPKARIQQVLTAADDMANAVTPYASVFVTAGLPADFVQQLQASAGAMLDALNVRDGSVARIAGATDGIRTLLAEGRRQVAILDKLLRVALSKDSPVLATWTQVTRVPKSTVATSARVSAAPAASAASAAAHATPAAHSATPATTPVAAVAPASPTASATAGAA